MPILAAAAMMAASMTRRSPHLLLVAILATACSVGYVEPLPELPADARPSPVPVPAAPRLTPTATAHASPAPIARVTTTPIPEPTVRPAPTGVATPPAPNATPAPTPAPAPPRDAFAFGLFEQGDFVPQHTFDWCVGASIQIAHNLVRADRRSSYEDQQSLWERARSHSTNSYNGANPRGWATVLEETGLGPYRLVSMADYDEALRTAAAAMHATERPVGLVMWRGRHAWVMSGFESIGDPAIHADFAVTGVRVVDPLYPYGSGVWGPSPEPNALLSPEELATQLVIREPRRWSSDLAAGYLLVLPVEPEPAA